MGLSLESIRLNKRVMAYTASAMYGAAAFDGAIEGFLPGDPKFSPEAMLRAADSALYAAKRAGRNRAVAFHGNEEPAEMVLLPGKS